MEEDLKECQWCRSSIEWSCRSEEEAYYCWSRKRLVEVNRVAKRNLGGSIEYRDV